MRIFLISGAFPSRTHTTRAANRVLGALVEEFTRQGHAVCLQVIAAADLEGEGDSRKFPGLEILPAFESKDFMQPAVGANLVKASSRLFVRFTNPVAFFYQASRLRSAIDQRVRDTNADVVLIFWSAEGLAATYGNHHVPKIAYYGVPDHFATLARLEDRGLFGVRLSTAALAVERQNLKSWETAHLSLMKDCDVAANLCAEHADYYTQRGHPRSIYVPNIWPDADIHSSRPSFSVRPNGKFKIFGSLGRLSATGNTYGLKYIGEELVPRLDKVFGPDKYEIHICGGGSAVAAVAKSLAHPSIKLRGWVDDIDAEIESSDVFLVANNTGRYRGAHTRFLHAWTLRACCVATAYNPQAMPEMVHMENALLGDTPDDVVELLRTAFRNSDLRRKIGQGGHETYQKYYRPEVVVGRLLKEMTSLVDLKRNAG